MVGAPGPKGESGKSQVFLIKGSQGWASTALNIFVFNAEEN